MRKLYSREKSKERIDEPYAGISEPEIKLHQVQCSNNNVLKEKDFTNR